MTILTLEDLEGHMILAARCRSGALRSVPRVRRDQRGIWIVVRSDRLAHLEGDTVTQETLLIAPPGQHRGRRKIWRDTLDWVRHQRQRLAAHQQRSAQAVRAYQEALAYRDAAQVSDGPDSDLVHDAEVVVEATRRRLSPIQQIICEVEHSTRH